MITPEPEEHATTPPQTAVKKTHVAPGKLKPVRKARRAKQAGKAGKPAAAARRGSKTAKVLERLKRPGGASLKELMKVTGWQPHSVRGFLSGTLRKKMGLQLESSRSEGQERVYRVRSK